MEHGGMETGRGKPKYFEINMTQHCFAHHKSNTHCHLTASVIARSFSVSYINICMRTAQKFV
jgi:hypothetical protein